MLDTDKKTVKETEVLAECLVAETLSGKYIKCN